MGVNGFTIDTPATIGDVDSWSVTESATQASPVEPVRGTPSFSAVAKRTDKTKFATHNGASFTHEKLGTIGGYVRSVNPVGVYSHLDCQTVLNQLNVDAEFSETFFPEGLLSDYVKQLVGAAGVQLAPAEPPAPEPDTGLVWTAATAPSGRWGSVGYGNGVFVVLTDGGLGDASTLVSTDGITWTPHTILPGSWKGLAYGSGRFVAVGTNVAATSTDGITWTALGGLPALGWSGAIYENGLFVAYGNIGGAGIRTSADGLTWSTPTTIPASVVWESITYGDGIFLGLAGSKVYSSQDGTQWTLVSSSLASTATSLAYGAGLFVATGPSNYVQTSPDGVTWTTPPAIGTFADRNNVRYANGLFVATGSNDITVSINGLNWTKQSSAAGDWSAPVSGGGMWVTVCFDVSHPVLTSGTFSPPAEWGGSTNPVVTYIPWRGNIWQMLNSLLMLNGVELVYGGGQMVVRDIGSHVIEIDNATAFNRTISAVDARQSVDVAYREAFAQTGTIYDAYVDGNKAYKIETNEYRQDKIVYEVPIRQWSLELNAMRQIGTITNVPTSLDQPTEAATGTKKPVAGQFVISDKDGLALPKGMFFGYGGSMKVSLNPVDPFSFYLTWRGPSTEIPDHPGPYSMQVGERGCFSVTGDAIFAYDKTVNVWTGADPAKVTDATPLALNVPFVNSKEQAFQVGAAAGAELCSTTDELSFDIATNALEGFGVTPGSIFRYDNANWRIVTCDIHGATATITARYHTTYADFDAAWDGKTFDQFDAAWDGFKFKDFGIEPLRTA